MKNFLVAKIAITIFCSIGFNAFAQQQMTRPSAPNNTCNSYDQTSQYSGYIQCAINYNSQILTYQNQVNQYNQNIRLSGGTPVPTDAGLVMTPNPPSNNCGMTPTASDTSAWQTHNNCISAYNNNKRQYEQAMLTVNSINQQIMAQASAAQAAEAQRLSQIQAQNQTSTTGTLQQVQSNTNSASKIYAVAGAVLAGYAAYKAMQSTQFFSKCTPYSGFYCVLGAAAAGAAVYFMTQSKKANGQVRDFDSSNRNVCQMNNTISSVKQNCNSSDPSSPIYNQAVETPPNETWYDPGTGQCKPDAPALCQQMMNGENGYKSIGNSLPKMTGSCTGAGTTACMAAFKQTVTQTPRGLKVSYKDKNGKEYTFYPDEFRDEKSLMGFGLTSTQAKKALAELAEVEETAKKALADAKKAGEGLEASSHASLGIGLGSSGDSGAGAAMDMESNRSFKDELKAVEETRKPSSAGLVKDFHGDMIGAAGDDIFTMMNRRYQLKNEQDTFVVAP